MTMGYVLLAIIFVVFISVLHYLSLTESAFKTKAMVGWAEIQKTLSVKIRLMRNTVFDDAPLAEPYPEVRDRLQWLEWVVIILSVLAYCLPFLDLGSSSNLPGPETELFQAFDQIL